jgi:hypothetical protein
MTPSDVVGLYAAAWYAADDGERHALLERAWAEGGTYCDPTATVRGREALGVHIAGFQQRWPGHRIELTSGVDEHDGHLRFEWRMLDPDGAVALVGIDFGSLGGDGRLEQIVGFFGPVPPA